MFPVQIPLVSRSFNRRSRGELSLVLKGRDRRAPASFELATIERITGRVIDVLILFCCSCYSYCSGRSMIPLCRQEVVTSHVRIVLDREPPALWPDIVTGHS
jgi:hypothetical protein